LKSIKLSHPEIWPFFQKPARQKSAGNSSISGTKFAQIIYAGLEHNHCRLQQTVDIDSTENFASRTAHFLAVRRANLPFSAITPSPVQENFLDIFGIYGNKILFCAKGGSFAHARRRFRLGFLR
jgi:hypothetical protein